MGIGRGHRNIGSNKMAGKKPTTKKSTTPKRVVPEHKISLTEFANDDKIEKFIIAGFRVWITREKKMNINTRTRSDWKKLYEQYLHE